MKKLVTQHQNWIGKLLDVVLLIVLFSQMIWVVLFNREQVISLASVMLGTSVTFGGFCFSYVRAMNPKSFDKNEVINSGERFGLAAAYFVYGIVLTYFLSQIGKNAANFSIDIYFFCSPLLILSFAMAIWHFSQAFATMLAALRINFGLRDLITNSDDIKSRLPHRVLRIGKSRPGTILPSRKFQVARPSSERGSRR